MDTPGYRYSTVQYSQLIIIKIYNHRPWIQQAIPIGTVQSCSPTIISLVELCTRVPVPGVLLVDLHGHGHPHEYIELGYRLTADLLNAIADQQVPKVYLL